MKRSLLIVLAVFVTTPVMSATLKMPPASEIKLVETEGKIPFPLSAGIFLGDDVISQVYVVKTSPFDRIKYPIGDFTCDIFHRNLPQIFERVVELDSPTATEVDVVVEVEIVRFEAVIPHPASNPYTASAVYKIRVKDSGGETILVQTVSGDGQTSKGMMSGFKAKQLAAESASRAMTAAAQQALEALADSPDLATQKNLETAAQ